eukprot:6204375-Pleurochrysis_carterae.AAC.2
MEPERKPGWFPRGRRWRRRSAPNIAPRRPNAIADGQRAREHEALHSWGLIHSRRSKQARLHAARLRQKVRRGQLQIAIQPLQPLANERRHVRFQHELAEDAARGDDCALAIARATVRVPAQVRTFAMRTFAKGCARAGMKASRMRACARVCKCARCRRRRACGGALAEARVRVRVQARAVRSCAGEHARAGTRASARARACASAHRMTSKMPYALISVRLPCLLISAMAGMTSAHDTTVQSTVLNAARRRKAGASIATCRRVRQRRTLSC